MEVVIGVRIAETMLDAVWWKHMSIRPAGSRTYLICLTVLTLGNYSFSRPAAFLPIGWLRHVKSVWSIGEAPAIKQGYPGRKKGDGSLYT